MHDVQFSNDLFSNIFLRLHMDDLRQSFSSRNPEQVHDIFVVPS